MILQLLPVGSAMEAYRLQANEVADAYFRGDKLIRRFVEAHHGRLRRQQDKPRSYWLVSKADVLQAMADWYYFESWMHLEEWVEAGVFLFDQAVEAIFAGDAAGLAALLKQYPDLKHARSRRRHHGTLLHYIAANGVEYYRDDYPKNMVEVLRVLVEAGADIHAIAEMYGDYSTTLGLVATSIHPAKAGVQLALINALLDAGAWIDHPGAAGNGHSTLAGCLANGRPEAADYLCRRGARLDLEGAAGVGRLDVLVSFFGPDGRLASPSTRGQLQQGFVWACEYGHVDVAAYLLDRGADLLEPVNGMNGLHYALMGGHLSTIRLLVERGAPLEMRNQYGGTALGMALWAVQNRNPVNTWPESAVDDAAIIDLLVRAGAVMVPGAQEWLEGHAGK